MSETGRFSGKALGNYRLLERIGAGGFGEVYRGVHNWLGTTAAVKVSHARYDRSDTQGTERVEALLSEARIHQKLKHPFILPMLDVGEDQREGLFYMVMEYAEGGSLRQRLKKYAGQPLPIREALTILWQIGQALDYAHRLPEGTVVHRDLKPENILFNARGDSLLADFGLATQLPSAQTMAVDTSGSPPYMSPEQFDNQVSVKSDQYALGCIAYELLTGRLPFPGGNALAWWVQHKTFEPENPAIYNSRLEAVLCQAILKALQKNRSDRHATILHFVKALQVSPPPISFTEQYREGLVHYDAGNFSAALAAYQEASLIQPDFADAHFNQGLALYQLGRWEQATAALQQAIVCDPGHVKAYVQSGITFSKRGLFVEAVDMYQKAVQLEPGYKKASEFLGNAHYELKHYHEAAQAYKQALGLDVDEVIKKRSGAIKNNPAEARVYMNLGLALKNCQKMTEALDAFESAIDLNSNFPQAYYNKGNLLSDCGLYMPAVNAFNKAIELNPAYAHAYRAKSRALTALGLLEEAQLAEEMAHQLENA